MEKIAAGKYPCYVDGEHKVLTMNIECLPRARVCFEKHGLKDYFQARLEEDPWAWCFLYAILESANQTDRVSNIDPSSSSMKKTINALFPDWPPERRAALLKGFGKREVTQMVWEENYWFCDDSSQNYYFPSNFEIDSIDYKIYQNMTPHLPDLKDTVKDLVNMIKEKELSGFVEEAISITGASRMKAFHDMVVVEYNRIIDLVKAKKLEKKFPILIPQEKLPPEVRFLENGYALLEEGRKMSHCVASYVDTCLSGNSYIFSVTVGDDSSTLQLDKRFNIVQNLSKYNKQPSTKIKDFLKSWLENYKKNK